jgi:NADPH:quinone reductase-like Zn-dependent oxidoreductase
VVAQWGCGGSVGDVVAQLGMWWLSWGCGGSVGDVVAQLAKATGRHQTEDTAVPGSNPAPPQSPERGQDI